jgi:hypothetical protein
VSLNSPQQLNSKTKHMFVVHYNHLSLHVSSVVKGRMSLNSNREVHFVKPQCIILPHGNRRLIITVLPQCISSLLNPRCEPSRSLQTSRNCDLNCLLGLLLFCII